MNKFISLIISAGYIVSAYNVRGIKLALFCMVYLSIPLLAIWVADQMDSFKRSIVVFIGWVLLLFPLIIFIYYQQEGNIDYILESINFLKKSKIYFAHLK